MNAATVSAAAPPMPPTNNRSTLKPSQVSPFAGSMSAVTTKNRMISSEAISTSVMAQVDTLIRRTPRKPTSTTANPAQTHQVPPTSVTRVPPSSPYRLIWITL